MSKLTIEIDNLTEPQALAIEDMLATWSSLGSRGSSRWTAFYADGDGDFRPKILVDGQKPNSYADKKCWDKILTKEYDPDGGNAFEWYSEEMLLISPSNKYFFEE